MRLADLYESNIPDIDLPDGVRHSLPHTVIFPDMDSYYEYYRFVVAMASHPELSDEYYDNHKLRDIPLAVAYTEQEFDMIKSVAKRLGKKWEEVAYKKSQELPGINAKSPVMPFKMTEAHIDCMKALMEIWEN